MQDALDKSYNTEIKLMEKMNGWIRYKNYPIIKVMRYYSHTDIVLENNDSFDNDLWVPITYTTQSDLNFNKTSLHHIEWQKFTPQKSYVEVHEDHKKDGWIIFNLQQAGKY